MFLYAYSNIFVIHHLLVISAYLTSLTYDYGSKLVFLTIFIGEITNPLQISWFLSKYLKYDKIKEFVFPIFACVFLIFRTIVFPLFFIKMYYQMYNDNIQVIPYFSLFILNLLGIFGSFIWCQKLIINIKKHFQIENTKEVSQ